MKKSVTQKLDHDLLFTAQHCTLNISSIICTILNFDFNRWQLITLKLQREKPIYFWHFNIHRLGWLYT